MKELVKLPNSTDTTIFEHCPEQYFFMTNQQVSTLGGVEMSKSSLDDLCVFQMGYTNLYLYKRFLLWNTNTGFYKEYAEDETSAGKPRHKARERGDIGKYFIIGDLSDTYFAKEGKSFKKNFDSFEDTVEYLKPLESFGKDKILIVAKMLDNIFWH